MLGEITSCRVCGNSELVEVLSLGEQVLSGHFPLPGESIPRSPLILVKCHSNNDENCGLLQLKHTYNLSEMYGQNYGYRSSLNSSMVVHLKRHVQRLEALVQPIAGDIIMDIGSNDGTLLQQYQTSGLNLVGVDPTIAKFSNYYPPHIMQIADFFPSQNLNQFLGSRKVKIVSSIAMFYDLEQPVKFVRSIADVLADDGVWLFEQSYMPTMLNKNSYDTICHEHLEYYGLKQIQWILTKAGLKIVDVEMTDANGGSFAVTAAHKNNTKYQQTNFTRELLNHEKQQNFDSLTPYEAFAKRVEAHQLKLKEKVSKLNASGRRVIGYGASTKGNVILQYCGFSQTEIPFIYEVNDDKFGRLTPGTGIPIVRENLQQGSSDVLLVLPWHFRPFFEVKLQHFLESGGSLLFPLPEIEVLSKASLQLTL